MMLRVESPEESLFPPRQILPAVLFAAAYVVIGGLLLVNDRPPPPAGRGPDRAGRIRAIHFHEQLARR